MIAGFLLTVLGALLLSIAMKKHFRQLFPGGAYVQGRARATRAAGFVALAAAAAACTSAMGIGVGLTLFFGLLTVAVFGLALLLPVIDRR